MKKFVLMHYGFEKPSPEIMQAWMQWFESIKEHTVENFGFKSGREINKSGTHELPMDCDAITGISIIEAESLEQAEALAEGNPFITSIRIYEVMVHHN